MSLKLNTLSLIAILCALILLLWHHNSNTTAKQTTTPLPLLNEFDVFGKMDRDAERAGRTKWRTLMGMDSNA